MIRYNDSARAAALLLTAILLGLGACSSSDSPANRGQQQAPRPIGLSGVVSDGPVSGGSIYVLNPQQLLDVLGGISPGEDLHDALIAIGAGFVRDTADEDRYEISLPESFDGRIVFLVFDRTDAEDMEFGDEPPFLMSVAVLGAGGSQNRVNITLHTTLIAQQIWLQLDPDGDGSPVDDGQIATLLQTATLAALDALGEDSIGRDLFEGMGPIDGDDDEAVHRASSELGLLLRELAAAAGLTLDEILAAIAADAADGDFDGVIPALANPSVELEALAQLLHDLASREDDEEYAIYAVGSCSTSAVALRRACAADVVDDGYESRAICADIAEPASRAICLIEAGATDIENAEECDEVLDARLEVCDAVMDAPHDPPFGMAYAANFVNPMEIGNTITPNPYFPLVPGNRWTYQNPDELIVVEVLTETKLIDGITCVTVNDIVTEDGDVIEDTDDWYAQDVDGNVWYCGEIAENYELFDGDDPEEPELVDLEGSWKHGREGAEAGMLLPFDPVPGTTIRQEVLFGEAEDVIDILSVTADEATAGNVFTCANACLQTRDYTPLEPDVEEHKFYAPDIGLIVELDPDTGERLELIDFTPGG